MPRVFGSGLLMVMLAVAVLLPLGLVVLSRPDPGGEIWRRGFMSGDQLRLFVDRTYRLERWTCLGPDEPLEYGSWSRLGDTVSLVPSAPGRPARLLRESVDGDDRFLREPAAASEEPFERVD